MPNQYHFLVKAHKIMLQFILTGLAWEVESGIEIVNLQP
jgi:hypothetical protein